MPSRCYGRWSGKKGWWYESVEVLNAIFWDSIPRSVRILLRFLNASFCLPVCYSTFAVHLPLLISTIETRVRIHSKLVPAVERAYNSVLIPEYSTIREQRKISHYGPAPPHILPTFYRFWACPSKATKIPPPPSDPPRRYIVLEGLGTRSSRRSRIFMLSLDCHSVIVKLSD